ncbi:MAG: glycerol-3-phosphate 1-O-acyltransferase PlsY [Rhodoferax sp.]|uniref:glycerol-3-phosphate 1-O-acyltransferase PlsY n=1 Tax=Rhodoferax sp. TaxID=50421 RepID=UPI002ACD30C3|nr:glycerol-3-phosphate 1-O-acyltransferase PlsY [Rhodoferax sp.]MDZ7893110.1 glycerol-3-phosphate 1-O-acyltransferase PlsY [Rhodoferax sp.]
MNSVLYPLLATVAAYLIGSLSFAVIVSRVMGLNDPRTYGSKNPGATNVLRSGSKAAAVVTLLLDAVKGWLPVAAIQWWGQPYGLGEGTMALAGFAAFIGHLYPVFFKFVGGKGVATAMGVLVATSGGLALATGLTWLVVAYAFRYSSLASLVAALFAPAYYAFGDGVAWITDRNLLLSTAVMSIFLIWRHSENISRLVKGTESKLGKKKEAGK